MTIVLPTGTWFSPRPDILPSIRLGLDLGLRRADLHMRERIVPGLGGAWFTRQLTWPCIALQLARTTSLGRDISATTLARGIEALAARIDFLDLPNRDGGGWRRVRGIRAFGKIEDDDCWSFGDLTDRRNYVQVTHRQQAVASLRGLGLAEGTRFDRMELTPIGDEIADTALGQKAAGPTSLRTVLEQWIGANDESAASGAQRKGAALRRVLSAFEPTPAEIAIIRRRLLDVDDEAGRVRKALAGALSKAGTVKRFECGVPGALDASGHASQAADVRAAMAFGEMQTAGRTLLERLATVLHRLGGRTTMAVLARECADECESLAQVAEDFGIAASVAEQLGKHFLHPDALTFVNAVAGHRATDIVRAAVGRAPTLFLGRGDDVSAAPSFRIPERPGTSATPTGAEEEDEVPTESIRTFRMAAFDEFLKEVGR